MTISLYASESGWEPHLQGASLENDVSCQSGPMTLITTQNAIDHTLSK